MRRFHASVIPLMLSFGVLAGVFIAAYFQITCSYWTLIGLIGSLLLISVLRKGLLRVVFGFLCGALLGIMMILPHNRSLEIISQTNSEIRIAGRIVSEPQSKDDQLSVIITDVVINSQLKLKQTQLYITVPQKLSMKAGDNISFSGKISQGIGKYSGFVWRPQDIIITTHSESFFASIRRKIIEKSQNILGKNDISALGLGYLIGQKGQLSDALSEEIRLAGMSHMIVVSGFHLGIAIMTLRRLTNKLSRFAVLFSACIVSYLFLAIVGFGSGLLRASIVTLLSLYAWYFGRRFHPVRLLAYAAAITLFVDPTLIKDIAWQYSFAAFAGLTLFAPILAHYFYGERNISWLSSIIIQSFSAQLFCLPISIYNFGAVSIVSLLSNIVISPSIAIIMLLMLAICLTPPWLCLVFAKPAELILRIHIFIIEKVASIPWATIEFKTHDARIFLLYIPLMLLLLVLKRRSKFSFCESAPALEKTPEYGKIYIC